MTHGETKSMLKDCINIRQIDEILNKTYCKTDADKADYLKQLFDVKPAENGGHSSHRDYIALATAIIHHRVA